MKKRIPFLLLILLLSVYTFSQERGLKKVVRTPQGKEITLYKGSYALVVGNGKYTAGWDELLGAVKDAEEIADVLRRKGFRVTLVKNVDKRTFLSELSNFTYRYGQDEDNQLLFYYAGHGHTITLASAEEMGMLVMVDAPLPEKDPQDFDSKSVDMKSIITWALKMKSKHVLFMFDSCFSGTVLNLRERVMPKAISDAVMYPVRQFITAGRAAEPVPDRSVFKQLFIDILEGRVEEPIKDGYITGEELGLFLKNRVPEYNNFQHPQYGKIRDPNLDKGDFVFVLEKVKPIGASRTKLPPEPPETSNIDISSIKKAAEERERIKSRWDNWQTGMKSDFMEVEKLDKNTAYTNQEKKTAWRQYLDNYKTGNPYSSEDEQLRQRATQRLKVLSEVGISVGARISLRSTPRILSRTEAESIWNKSRDFINKYDVKTIRGDKVVLDHATGLMWHQSGSENNLTYNKAKQWIDELNSRDHADYTDWRLPTLEEAVSLLERSKMNGGLYVDPLFSTRQKWVWTSDRVMAWTGKPVIDSPGRVWVVSFSNGSVYMCNDDPGNGLDWETYGPSNYVRPVRSGQR